MLFKQKEGIGWYEFEILQPYNVCHGVFIKHHSGASCHFYQKKIQDFLGLQKFVFGEQVHEDHIQEVFLETAKPQKSCDGLVTSIPHIGLGVYHADCQAALFFDPKKRVVANIHCGWRGNQQNILGKAVKMLYETKGCLPEDLLVGISPSLGPERSQFLEYEKTWPPLFHAYQHKPFFFDLWRMSQDQLKSAGVLAQHMECARICTYESENEFYSYRRDKTTRRNFSMIALT